MLKEAAENSNKEKLQLKNSLSDISHQLKTPLTSILITLDNLIDDPDMDKEIKQDFIRDIKILEVDENNVNPIEKLKELISRRKYKAHEIVSIFSQHFYRYFNEKYENGPVYWHCKCSNIPRKKSNRI